MNDSELRALAEKATPGPWALAGWSGNTVLTKAWVDFDKGLVPRPKSWTAISAPIIDSRYIAAADPTTVLALLDRIAKLEAALRPVAIMADEMEKAASADRLRLVQVSQELFRDTISGPLRAALLDREGR